MTAKRRLLRIHVWAGVILGIFWLVQGLTGAVLVFNRDVQAAYLDREGGGAPLPLDVLLARSGAAIGAPVTRLETFGPDPMLLLAYHKTAAGERVAVVDARTAAVLDRRDMHAALPAGGETWPWLLRLHEALLADDTGLLVVGASGLLLVATMAVGLWNALPFSAWRQARRATRSGATRLRMIGWHRLVGLAAALPLLVVATCGVYLAFAPQARAALVASAGYIPAYKPKAQDAPPAVAISSEQAYAAARHRFPGATLVRLVLPTAKSPVYLFRLLQPDDARRWAGTSSVAIDPASGAVVDAFDSRNAPLANRVTDAIYSIHTGDVAGGIGRTLVLLAGLALPTFAITGWIGWWRSRAKQRIRA